MKENKPMLLSKCAKSLHKLWIDWNEVAAVNGVNPYGTDPIKCEIEVIFKSGKSITVCLGEMIGVELLCDCPMADYLSEESLAQ